MDVHSKSVNTVIKSYCLNSNTYSMQAHQKNNRF